jgi:hypothetical protein
MKMAKKYHIIKRDDGWAIKKEGSRKASKIHGTREKATSDAQKYRKMGSDIIIHKRDGTIYKWQKKK